MEDKFGCNDFDFSSVKDFASWILKLSPLEFTTLGTIIGYLISSVLTVQEQNSVGNWFELVGQIILTFNAQGSANIPPSASQYCSLVNQVINLQQQINELKIAPKRGN